MYPNRTKISKSECLARLRGAFDAVLAHEHISIHVRAHLMEALAELQSAVNAWRVDAVKVRRELLLLKDFMQRCPGSFTGSLHDRIETVIHGCRAYVDGTERGSSGAQEAA